MYVYISLNWYRKTADRKVGFKVADLKTHNKRQYHLSESIYESLFSIGLTLALTVIPMGMGYAALAGLPLQVNDILQWSTLHYTPISLSSTIFIVVVWTYFIIFQYGLYASYVPGFIYAIFGTCKEVTIGPTAVNALMTHNYAGNINANIVEAALTLGFFSGLIEIGTGILNLGKVYNGWIGVLRECNTTFMGINLICRYTLFQDFWRISYRLL